VPRFTISICPSRSLAGADYVNMSRVIAFGSRFYRREPGIMFSDFSHTKERGLKVGLALDERYFVRRDIRRAKGI
jgi:hypothetical protein